MANEVLSRAALGPLGPFVEHSFLLNGVITERNDERRQSPALGFRAQAGGS
jgi:hypothetical protein